MATARKNTSRKTTRRKSGQKSCGHGSFIIKTRAESKPKKKKK